MIFVLNDSDHSAAHQQQLRQWYFLNGLVHSELCPPSLVDAVAATVTVQRRLPKPGQEDHDFPEFVTDDHDAPVIQEQVQPLTVMPLQWMLTNGAGRSRPCQNTLLHRRLTTPASRRCEQRSGGPGIFAG